MKVLYIADDGKQFDNKEECQEYELIKKWETADSIILAWDGNGYPMKFSDSRFADDAFYISCKTDEAVSIFIDRAHYEGISYTGVISPGAYCWEDCCDKWGPVSSKLAELKEEIKLLENIIKS